MQKLHRRRIKALFSPRKDKMVKAPNKAKELDDGLESTVRDDKGGEGNPAEGSCGVSGVRGSS